MQIRVDPRRSPPSVAALVALLAAERINLVGAGGSDLEFGGEFAFAVDHGDEERALKVLDDAEYRYRVFRSGKDPELKLCWLQNEPGQLRSCIDEVSTENQEKNRSIRDILIGVATDEGIPVQIFSEGGAAADTSG